MLDLKYSKFMPVTDHLGNFFETVVICCEYWDIPEHTFRNRFLKGWDIEKILTKEIVRRNFPCSDHLGNGFKSATEMCDAYGIDYGIYENRVTSGMSVKDALTTPVRQGKRPVDNPNGTHYESVSELSEKLGISRGCFYSRLERDFSEDELFIDKIERGLKRPSERLPEYKGIRHNSYRALCKFYNFPYVTFMRRLNKLGWPIDKILETPVRPHELPQPNTSEMVSEMP